MESLGILSALDMDRNPIVAEDLRPDISVIIPVYNAETFISQCLESVLAQAGPRLEIIIVDDASQDSSMVMVEQLLSDCPASMSVKICRHEENRGVSAARNSGIEMASGKYLYFLDSDDWLPGNSLSVLLKEAEEHGADVTTGSRQCEFSDGKEEGGIDSQLSYWVYNTNEELLAGYCSRKIPFFQTNKLVRRNFIDEAGLHCEESVSDGEDQLWIFKAVLNANRWISLDTVTYSYRKNNPNSLTSLATTTSRLGNYYRVLECMVAETDRHKDASAEKLQLIARAFLNFTKSILWHIECEPVIDHRRVYTEFRKRNILQPGTRFYRYLDTRNKVFAFGWGIPYPVNRFFCPYYLANVKSRMTRTLSK